ncbi:MAG TPA: plasmid pRiA4b ORF-3 family protein [Gemmataceae bacterium]
MAKSKPEGPTVYQLKVTLAHIKPPIWRRVEVPDCALAELSKIIQACFGWGGYHLWSFEVGGEEYGPEPAEDLWGGPESGDPAEVRLSDLARRRFKKLRYVYDFGDDWRHDVEIEKKFPAEEGVQYPRCTKGKRAGPPEDCGGPYRYPYFLETLRDPTHPEHEEMVEWVGGSFDPEEFDPDAINARLAQLPLGEEGAGETGEPAPEWLGGRWRIASMEEWGADYIDAEVPAYIEFGGDNMGEFQFGYVRGEIDYRPGTRDGDPAVEFSWEGEEELEPVSGRGWAVRRGGELYGEIYTHLGESSGFVARRGEA